MKGRETMTRIPVVTPWIRNVAESECDIFIATIGYERRARFIAETLGLRTTKKFASAFPHGKVLNYDENYLWFENAGYEIEETGDSEFRDWCQKVLSSIESENMAIRHICIDISSFDRYRLAVLVDTIRNLPWSASIKVDFLYSVAEFSAPPAQIYPNRIVGPVLASFAGWTMDPDKPPIAVVGLGYEEDKALGAVEHIQASDVWAFIPISTISDYGTALESANQTLLESIRAERRLTYEVERPIECFIMLESLTNRILKWNSPIIFPFGPKIFTICSLLVASLYQSVAVWRVSSGGDNELIDRLPNGQVYGISAEFGPDAEVQVNSK
jgi:hypothetical protein